MSQPSILIIDDEPENFDVIEVLLSDQHYELYYTSNGQDVMNYLDVFQPDVILLDVMMPEEDGIEVCKRLKALPKWQSIPIIMVTALTAKEDLARCLTAGADDFISKPVNSIELKARINSMLRIKHQYDQLQTSLKRQAVLEAEKLELLESRNIELEKQVEERTAALNTTANQYITLANLAPVGIFRCDTDKNCVYVNQRWCDIAGITLEEVAKQGWLKAVHPDDQDTIIYEWNIANQENLPFNLEYRFLWADQTVKWVFGQAVAERNAHGHITGYLNTITDISELKKAQELIFYNAFHDSLTDLPNRRALMEKLKLAINRAKRDETYNYAVLFLDLDRFKVINDSLGHLAGDQLVRKIAQKLKIHLRKVDFLARLGGDEFVILVEEMASIQSIINITESILKAFETPLMFKDYEMFITMSIGIVFATKEYSKPEDLLRDADLAMYRAKVHGRSSYKIFDAEMHTQAVNRLTLENELHKALERQEFIVYYQPIMDIHSHLLMGFEGLVRWQHPTRGFISPQEFVSLAEETGLIVQIDRWMLHTACQQLASWKTEFANHFPLKMSINLSVKDLRQASFLDNIDQMLAETGLDGDSITLEITESMLIEKIQDTIDLLDQLKARKIKISIDDFGTGYSSLNYLHCLPADNLKIDRSFVAQMLEGNRNYQIVSTIIALSNELGLSVIAEGIETPHQLQWLKQLGCEFGQGYLFSKPLPAKEIETKFLLRPLGQNIALK